MRQMAKRLTCDKCPEAATWGFSTATVENPAGSGLRTYCAEHARVLQSGISHTRDMTLLQRQNLLTRLRPLDDFEVVGVSANA